MNHVLVLARSLPQHHLGGMEAVAWDISRELLRYGRVTVVTTSIPGRPDVFESQGVRIHALPHTASGLYSKNWWNGSRGKVAELLRTERITGLLSVSAAGFSCLEIGRKSGARLVLQAHGTSLMEITSKIATGRPRQIAGVVKNLRGLAIDAQTYRRFDSVVAVGDVVAQSLTRTPLGSWVAMPPVHQIPNGIDIDLFTPDSRSPSWSHRLGIPQTSTILLSAGRLHTQKRVGLILEAAPHLPEDFHLVIAGDGPERGRLQAIVERQRIQARTHFVGALERTELASLHASSTLHVLTSGRREVGVPMTALESLACGTPVVSGLAATLDGMVQAQVEDPRALAAAIIATASRPRTGSLLPPTHSLREVGRQHARLLGVPDA